jgi:CubicO group peptidase (beta-lactamase class C family)
VLAHSRIARRATQIAIAFGSFLFAASLLAAEIKTTKPERVGMSSERLARIGEIMQRHIDAGRISGAVTAVSRRGKLVHFAAHGYSDPTAKTPMPKDAIFRMASSSKPVTAVAILMLVEEGRVRLHDPISAYVPEFKNMKVAVPKQAQGEGAPRQNDGKPEVDLVAAAREITIEDLLTHTSGLQSGGLGNRVLNVQRAPSDTLASFVPKYAAAPLDFQPGTRWSYSPLAGIEVLGRIVEIASGLTFDEFLRQRIFQPLDMHDTFFGVPNEKQGRLLTLYRRSGIEWQSLPTPSFLDTQTYFSGAAGLYSTARDYVRFEQMLVNGGELHGKRLLGTKTVGLMSMNHTRELYRGLRGTDDGVGFGLAVQVTVNEANSTRWRTAGSFGWSGIFGTITWSDPAEELVGVLMLQQSEDAVQRDFGTAVMQAIIESNVR